MYRMNLAYQDLSELPDELRERDGPRTEELDLSYNKISRASVSTETSGINYNTDLRFLLDFPNLTTLILDHNQITAHVKLPKVPKLQTLWVNHNKIKNLGTFVSTLGKNCGNLKYLCMMNNEAAPSYFNGGTYQQYMDYRYYVISCLPKLEVLDDTRIEESERAEAERIYPRKVRNKKSSQKKSDPPSENPNEIRTHAES